MKRPHGLKGEGEFYTATGSNTFLERGHTVWLRPLAPASALPPEGKHATLTNVRKGNQVLLSFEGVPDRTALEKILPFEVLCDRDMFPALEEGNHYVVDLLGLTVLDEQGNAVGKIESSYDTPGSVVFTVALKSGERVDLPYVKNFFPAVDLEAGTVTVVLPEVLE